MHRITTLVSSIDPIRSRLSPRDNYQLILMFNTMTFFFRNHNHFRVDYEVHTVVGYLRGLGHYVEFPS